MDTNHLFDRVALDLARGAADAAVHTLVGALAAVCGEDNALARWRAGLRAHPLHALLLEDPATARAFTRPRGTPGDPVLIDYYLNREAPPGTSELGTALFAASTTLGVGRALEFRRADGATRLEQAWAAGRRVCALGCGHWREGDGLAARDTANSIAVDPDPISLETVWARHGGALRLVEADPLRFLHNAARDGDRFDCIHAPGLCDRLDDAALGLHLAAMRACLAPGGEILLASMVPGHLSRGWMDAVMDWRPLCRNETDLLRHFARIGLSASTLRDPGETIVLCELRDEM